MKKHLSLYRKGFTLVELLVVISIIAVLASLGVAGTQVAQKKAKSTETLNLAISLQMAINSYYDEYGNFPIQGSIPDSGINTKSVEGIELLKILTAKEANTGTVLNTRGIPFLQLKQAKKNKVSGLAYQSGTNGDVTGLFDAWGEPFFIFFDKEYKDEVQVDTPFRKPVSDSGIIRGTKAVIFSKGSDKLNGTDSRNRDNISTN
jgi:prepilin-type N-terminal cleavage/methylation domain-containing protein